MHVLDLLIFILLTAVLWYLPGRFILRISGFRSSETSQAVLCSFAVGIGIFLIATYILSWVRLEFLYSLLAVIFSLVEIRHIYFLRRTYSLKKISFFPNIFLILLGSVVMSFIMWTSAQYTKDGSLLFYAVNAYDGIWHISLIENLTKHFPPTHPGLSDISLRGYNFFYDLLIANIHKLYPIPIVDLVFHYMPFALSLLFGIATLAMGKFLKFTKIGVAILLFLTYFAQGFGTFLPLMFSFQYQSPIVHSAANIADPSVVLSLILFYAAFILLFAKKPSLLAIFCLAVLPMIKIYMAVLAFVALAVVACFALFGKREYFYGKILLLSGFFAAILYLPINFGAGSLVFAPLLLYRHYMESGSVIPEYQWILKLQTFEAHQNYLRIALLYILALFFFFVPSLGIRLISIFSIKNLFRKDFYILQNIFLFTVVVVGIVIPSLFIQSVAVFVVVQFLWIIYILLLIPTAFTLQHIIRVPTITKIFVLSIVLIGLSVIDMRSLFILYTTKPVVISKDLMNILTKVRNTVPEDQNLLVLPTVLGQPPMLGFHLAPVVSGLSGRDVYYEPEVLEFLKVDEEVRRKKFVAKQISLLQNCQKPQDFLSGIQNTKVRYVVTFQPYSCLNTINTVRKIHTSGMYSLYEVTTE